MATEFSDYMAALETQLKDAYMAGDPGQPRWSIYRREEGPRIEERPWAIELSVFSPVPVVSNNYEPVAQARFSAVVHYECQAPEHSSFFQCHDITASIAAYITDLGSFAGNTAVTDVSYEVFVSDEAGRYFGQITWSDEIILDSAVRVPGYRVTPPPAARPIYTANPNIRPGDDIWTGYREAAAETDDAPGTLFYNRDTGVLTVWPFAVDTDLSGMLASGTLYAGLLDDTTNTFRLYSVNTDTGALTQVGSNQSLGSSNWDGCGLAVLSGTLYAGLLDDTTDTFRLYSVNTDTGALTQVGSNQSLGSGNWEGCGLAVLSGTLYAGLLDDTTNTFRLYSVNTDTGALTQVGSNQSLGSSDWDGCGLAVLSGTLYAGLLDDTTNTFRLYSVNTDTGALTQVGSNQSLGSGNWEGCGLAVLSGTLYAGLLDDTTDTFRLYSVNTDTGALTQVGSNQSLGSSDWEGCGLAVLSGDWVGVLDREGNGLAGRIVSVARDAYNLPGNAADYDRLELVLEDLEAQGISHLSGRPLAVMMWESVKGKPTVNVEAVH